jgi:hypothetical protein
VREAIDDDPRERQRQDGGSDRDHFGGPIARQPYRTHYARWPVASPNNIRKSSVIGLGSRAVCPSRQHTFAMPSRTARSGYSAAWRLFGRS